MSSTLDGSYKAGDTLLIQVAFDGPLHVTGYPQLALAFGLARPSSLPDSTARVMTFSYTVQSRDTIASLDVSGTWTFRSMAGPSSLRKHHSTLFSRYLFQAHLPR